MRRWSGIVPQFVNCLIAVVLAGRALWGAAPATFGTVVPLGGHAADLALDERRGLLYAANLTANRIDVVSTADRTVRYSISLSWQPSSVALSADGRYLVVTHYWNFQPSTTPPVTVIDTESRAAKPFTLGLLGLSAAFGINNQALILTTKDFRLLDPVTGAIEVLDTIVAAAGKTLPVPLATMPPDFVRASLAPSGDGQWVYGVAESGAEGATQEGSEGAESGMTLHFRYRVNTREISVLTITASPPLGPRVISVNQDGSAYLAGWGLFTPGPVVVAQFPKPSGLLSVGSHAFDPVRGLIYAQVPEPVAATTTNGTTTTPPAAPPVLQIVDADNLAVRERLRLPENLAGKSVLSRDGATLYSISDSGLLVLPVGALAQARRVVARQEDVVFRGNFCDRQLMTQEIEMVDPGGGSTDFKLTASAPGLAILPAAGTTPAKVKLIFDPSTIPNQRGTAVINIDISSATAVNLPPPVRILINNREPDQRGAFFNVPGKLVDLLADPFRNQFYVLRQDRNQVLVFSASDYRQIVAFRTGNTPTQLALTLDGRYLLVGNDNSQIANVYDLARMQPETPIVFPLGHYPRSIAASAGGILAASRVAGPNHTIDQVNLLWRVATTLPSLGVWENKIHINTVLVGSPSGSAIMAAMPDGNLLLYDAAGGTFTHSRKDFTELSGPYAASPFGRFLVGNVLLNSSLVPLRRFDADTGTASGFAFTDQYALKTASAGAAPNPGVIQRLDVERGETIRPTRMTEAPLLGQGEFVFTRTLAVLPNRNTVVSLTTSGFTVLGGDYDAPVPMPQLERVVNLADGSDAVAAGSLFSVLGVGLSPISAATAGLPMPTALAESCLTVNGYLVPMMAVSPTEIKGQLPFHIVGTATMLLRTPSAVSTLLPLSIRAAAPSVFRSGVAGPDKGLATVFRAKNGELVTPSNPIHPEETIVIYATGLGRTSPAVEAGVAAPADPPARALTPVEVTLGEVPLEVFFAGLVPGQAGVYQINAAVPGWVKEGLEVPLAIRQAGYATTLIVRVVK